MTSEVFDMNSADQSTEKENPQQGQDVNVDDKSDEQNKSEKEVFDEQGRPAESKEKDSDTADVFRVGEVFSSYVGEGKKFRDTEELAKGKKEADEFIEHLLQETKEVKEDLAKREKAEEALSKAANKAEEVSQKNTTSEVVDEARLAELVKRTMTEMEQSNTAKRNKELAGQQLIEATGSKENAQKLLSETADSLNYSVDQLMETAQKSPTALMRLLGLEGKGKSTEQKSNSFSHNQARTAANTAAMESAGGSSNGPEVGSAEYFSDLRRNDPNKYYSKDTQLELLRAKKDGRYK